MVVEWDYEKKGDGKLIVKVDRPIYSYLLLEDKRQLVFGTSGGNIHIVDLKTNKEIKNIEFHKDGVYDIHRLGNYFLTAGGEGLVAIWDVDTFGLVKVLRETNKSARVIAINPQGNEIAVGYSDNKIRIYNADSFELIKVVEGHENSVFALAYSPDGKYLLSGGRDAVLKIWDIHNAFELKNTINAHWYHINSIKYNSDGSLFATVSMDKTIKIWEADTFTLLKVIDKERQDAHISSVNKVLWISPNKFISCSDDKTAQVFELSFITN